jgi:G3E family GTPase
VTVLSGFLGAGKTSLLQHLLRTSPRPIALIVNDVAELNVDAKLLKAPGATAPGAAGLVELQNGCACCDAAGDLLAGVQELLTLSDLRAAAAGAGGRFSDIVVESSGVGDPAGIRRSFQDAAGCGLPLLERARLDTMVTVVDVASFRRHLGRAEEAGEGGAPDLHYRSEGERERRRGEAEDWFESLPGKLREALEAGGEAAPAPAPQEREASVCELLMAQVECADVVLLNKCDLASEEELGRVTDIVRALNPKAEVRACERGRVGAEEVLASKGGRGVADAGMVDDHKDAVRAAERGAKERGAKERGAKERGGGKEGDCEDPECADDSHSHSHSHSHSASAAAAADCSEPGCTDPSHSHSHSHSHSPSAAADCSDPDCTDSSHSHSHASTGATPTSHAGISSFVYKARRPFHPGRLSSLLSSLPLPASSGPHSATFATLLRSKGFCWLACSHEAAHYWAHAGSAFEMQAVGRWWATVERDRWPAEAEAAILEDFEGEGGDRRQEIVVIGEDLDGGGRREGIVAALDGALLDEEELALYGSLVREGKEGELPNAFPSDIVVRRI